MLQVAIYFASTSLSIFHTSLILLVSLYVLWVLLGTVAWVSHLGDRASFLSPYLPASGYPSNTQAASIVEFLMFNVPLALFFVLPHSLLKPGRIYPYFGVYARLLYNFISACCLHFFLYSFIPLKTPIMMTLPLPKLLHIILSVSCLSFAMITFLLNRSTWSLLGVSQILECTSNLPDHGMDIITWMGITVWQRGGALAFVLFTGLSILPMELTLGDCITRGVAAIYLRQRSPAFRKWIDKIEQLHLLTWVLRASLLFIACASVSDGVMRMFILGGAGSLALLLRVFEST